MPAHFSQTLRSLKADNARSAHFAWGLSGVLLAAWAGWFCFASVTVYETSGKLRLEAQKETHQIEAQISGQILVSNLSIGKDVQEGDVVVEFDATDERHRHDEELARLTATSNRIVATQREIEARQKALEDGKSTATAEADMVQSRIASNETEITLAVDLDGRTATLVASGTSTKISGLKTASELKRLKEEHKTLQAELRRVSSELDRKNHEIEADIENLKFQLAQAEGEYASGKSAVERLSADIEKRLIRSPITGQLGDVLPYHAGSFVAQGSPLATIIPAGDLIAVAEFNPSTAIGRIKPGQAATLKLDAFPWAQFGTIDAIVTTVANEPRDNVLRVEFSIDTVRARQLHLQHGLPGIAEVQIENVSPAELILRSAGIALEGKAGTKLAQLQP